MATATVKSKSKVRIIGQESTRRQLAESLRSGRAPHAYLFAGPRGIGKTAVALEYAQLLLCDRDGVIPCGECEQCLSFRSLQHPDLKIYFPLPPKKSGGSEDEVKEFAAQIGKVNEALSKDRYAQTRLPNAKEIRLGFTRSLLHSAALKPYQSKRKVFVILHAESMNEESQNALLKALEEPYPESHFALVTDNEGGLRATIRSRCQRIRMVPLAEQEIYDALIADEVVPQQAELAARLSGGSYVHAGELAGPDIEKVQTNVVSFLRGAAICDPLELPQAAANLLETGDLPEYAGLEMLGLFLRDAAVFRATSSGNDMRKLAFGNLQDKIHGVITAYPQADFEQALRAVDESTEYLTRGYTKEMVLYALAIRLNEALGPLVRSKRATTAG